MGRFRIHDRIVIPFALIALMATAAAALLSASLISNVLESRVEAQIPKGSALVSQAQFALNPSILHLVKDIVDAEVITYSREGTTLASTVDPQAHPDLVRRVIAEQPPEADVVPGGRYVLRRMDSNGTPYIVAYRRAVERPGTLIAFASNQSEVMSALRIARRAILMTAGFSLLLLIAVTRLVARRVTAPFEELLATSQDALVRSEKLAVTGLLAARVAHDVRNPLSSIKMQTQLLKLRRRDDRDSQTVLQAILHDIEQVEGVVRGLLHLARPGELNLTRARLPDLVDDLLRHLSPQMAHRNIAVETRIDAGSPRFQSTSTVSSRPC